MDACGDFFVMDLSNGRFVNLEFGIVCDFLAASVCATPAQIIRPPTHLHMGGRSTAVGVVENLPIGLETIPCVVSSGVFSDTLMAYNVV